VSGHVDGDGALVRRDVGSIRVLTLNRPDQRNAFTVGLYRALAAALRQADTDESVRAVVVTGAGPAFSAGTDLGELAAIAAGDAPEGAGQAFPALIDALSEVDVPLVAAVNGAGVGLGMTMLSFFDLVFMADTARLKAPFAAMGVPPEAASSTLFPIRMGWQRAAWALLSASWLSAAEAVSAGLVTAACPAEEVLAEAVRAAGLIAAHERRATRTVKALMRAGERDVVRAARAREDDAFRRLFTEEEPAL